MIVTDSETSPILIDSPTPGAATLKRTEGTGKMNPAVDSVEGRMRLRNREFRTSAREHEMKIWPSSPDGAGPRYTPSMAQDSRVTVARPPRTRTAKLCIPSGSGGRKVPYGQ